MGNKLRGKIDNSIAAKPKSNKRRRAIIAIVIVLSVVIASVLTIYLICKKTKSDNEEIRVGDTVITKEQIDVNTEDMESFLQGDPDLYFIGEGSTRDIARRSLILNAALKDQAGQCKVSITDEDVLRAGGVEGDELNGNIDELIGVPGNYNRVMLENVAYKESLSDCLIKSKDIFMAFYTYTTPYNDTLSTDEVNKLYDRIKAKLNDEFMPMFRNGASSEDIARYAEENGGLFEDSSKNLIRMGTSASSRYLNFKGSEFNDNEDAVYPGNPGSVVSLNDVVNGLDKAGEFTDIVVGQNGEMGIIRVDAIHDGEFISWEDYEKSVYDKYDKEIGTSFFEVIGQALASFWRELFGSSEANAANYVCGTHTYNLHLSLQIKKTSAYIKGSSSKVSVSTKLRNQIGTDISPSCTKDESKAGITTSNTNKGKKYKGVDCGYDFELTVTSSNYYLDGYAGQFTHSISYNGVSYKGENSKTKVRGIVNGYSMQLNGVPDVYATIYFKEKWGLTPSSGVSPTQIYAHQTAAFNHKLKVKDGNMDKDTSWSVVQTKTGVADVTVKPSTKAKGNNGVVIVDYNNTFQAVPGDIGKEICQYIYATPAGSATSVKSTPVCVTVIPYPWQLTLTTQVQRASAGYKNGTINVKPGDVVHYRHRITASHPMNVNTNWIIETTGSSDGSNGPLTSSGAWAAAYPWHNGYSSTYTVPEYSQSPTYEIKQNDVGHTICRRITTSPRALGDTRNLSSTAACAYVPYNYSITPKPENDTGNTVVEIGSTIKIDAKLTVNPENYTNIDSNQYSTKTKNTQWKLTEFILNPGVNIPGGATNTNADTCSVYRSTGSTECSVPKSGVNGVYNNGSTNIVGSHTLIVPDTREVGTKYCYAVSVNPPNSKNNAGGNTNDISSSWLHSDPICITIGKRPKAQVWGAGLYSEKGVYTSTTEKSGKVYGSWIEYEVLSVGAISTPGSASGLNGGFNGSTTNRVGYNKLTFANRDNSYGYFDQKVTTAIANKYKNATGEAAGASIDLPTDVNSNRTIHATGNTAINSTGTIYIGKGTTLIIVADGNLTINKDIVYTDEVLNNIDDIPQVLILAKNIYINPDVTRIDAWLVTTGTGSDGILSTCDSVTSATQLTAHICNRQLTVNGPVAANRLRLFRTAGSGLGAQSGDPAEVFNLRVDAYMWAHAQAGKNAQAVTTYIEEFAPRY